MFITNIRHQLSISSLARNFFLPGTISIKLKKFSKIMKDNSITVD